MLSTSKVTVTDILAEKLVYIQQSSGFLIPNRPSDTLQFHDAAESGKKGIRMLFQFGIEGGGTLFHACLLSFLSG